MERHQHRGKPNAADEHLPHAWRPARASGVVVAGKRRIDAHLKKHGAASVALHEFHHYAMIPFLRVARDDEGKLHLATATPAMRRAGPSWRSI